LHSNAPPVLALKCTPGACIQMHPLCLHSNAPPVLAFKCIPRCLHSNAPLVLHSNAPLVLALKCLYNINTLDRLCHDFRSVLTTGIDVEEPHGHTDDGGEHPVVQDLGGVEADEVEEDSAKEVQGNGDDRDASVNPQSRVVRETANGL